MISEFLQAEKVDILNTRAFKTAEGQILITVGSIDKPASIKKEFKGVNFEIKYGEFSAYLEEMNYYLSRALEYAANDTQK